VLKGPGLGELPERKEAPLVSVVHSNGQAASAQPSSQEILGQDHLPDYFSHVLGQLEGVIEYGKGWKALCPNPGHNDGLGDHNPSLGVDVGDDGRVLLHCWSGCSQEAVLEALEAVGLEERDLFCPDGETPAEATSNGKATYAGRRGDRAPLDRAVINFRDTVYRQVLAALGRANPLTHGVKCSLTHDRGLPDRLVGFNNYQYIYDSDAASLAEYLFKKHGKKLYEVPGFVEVGGLPRVAVQSSGLLIPCRSVFGKVVALKLRLMSGSKLRYLYWSGAGGPSCRAAVHCPQISDNSNTPPSAAKHFAENPLDVLRVTEGELKADVAWARSGVYTVSVPGVSNWAPVLAVLEELRPKRVLLSYDWNDVKKGKGNVRDQLRELMGTVSNLGYEVGVETWEGDHKGVDDALKAGVELKKVWGREAQDEVEGLYEGLTNEEGESVASSVHGGQSCPNGEAKADTSKNERFSGGQANSGRSGDSVHGGRPPRGGPFSGPPSPFLNLHAVKQFPLDFFPKAVAEFVSQAASKDLPVDFAAVPALVAVSVAAGANQFAEAKPGFIEPAILWAVLIAPPGSRKTPCVRPVMAPLRAIHSLNVSRYREEVAEWKRKEAERAGSGGVKPRCESVVVGDVTVEKLGQVCQDGPHGQGMILDEFTAWPRRCNAYKKAGADGEFYLSLWSGEQITVERVGQGDEGALVVDRPFVSVFGCTTPANLKSLRTKAVAGDGWSPRVLYSEPAYVEAETDSGNTISARASSAWSAALGGLYALPQSNGRLLQLGGEANVHVFDKDARDYCLKTFVRKLRKEKKLLDRNDPLREVYSKMEGYCVRFALLRHLLHRGKGQITVESVKAAEKLVEYFISHARRVYGGMLTHPAVEDAKFVLRKLRARLVAGGKSPFSRRDFFRMCRPHFHTVPDMDPGLNLLVAHDYIAPRQQSKRPGPGQPASPLYDLNPLWDHSRDD
jgi:hypothetical protein